MFISVDATRFFRTRDKASMDGLQFRARRPRSRGLAEILSFPEVTQVRIGHSWEVLNTYIILRRLFPQYTGADANWWVNEV